MQWWVCFRPFEDIDAQPWKQAVRWLGLSVPGIEHVLAWRRIGFERSLYINPGANTLIIDSVKCSCDDLAESYLDDGSRVFLVELNDVHYTSRRPINRPHMLTCAAIVSYAMGLERIRWTAPGLLEDLRRLGAEEI